MKIFFFKKKINFSLRTKSISRKEILVVKINFYEKMFELKELKIMFLDPTDLIINKINRLLNSNKTIKFIFS